MSAENKASSSSSTMWIGVGVVFALMALAWTAMFFFASKYRAESIPLPAREGAAH
jgi:flagellar basal body-associated protein FliL